MDIEFLKKMKQKYIGIIPYDENGGFEFAGRSEETWALYDRIARNDYTVYYAASGEGKSSLIRAGLLPILRRRNYFPVYIVFEDKELGDFSSIDSIIDNRIEIEKEKHNVSYEQSELSKSYFSIEESKELSSNQWWRLRNYCFKQGDTELKPFYIFDQFEEVFTKANYEWTNRFFTWLEEISTDYVPNSLREVIRDEIPVQKNFKALFSFRTEYLGDLDYWCVQKHFIPSLQENRMCLKPLTPNGAREVIYLNDALGKYADKIIQGCAESGNNIGNENQPCVYALILSVVCQTLSEMPDGERDAFLESLNAEQDNTIDDILLRFYKKKLKDVGLDYVKDEKIIADIEDALVDEKGKRSRRDTNEPSLLPLKEWIERLSDKKNGLIKEVGRKEVHGEIIKTVEFPHDRLCRAIDSSRKERQGKVAWKLKRQGEFMQFGIISVIMGIIAFLWNALMPALKPVIINFLHDSSKTLNLFLKDYLMGKQSKLGNYILDEGFSTLLLMILLVLFVPLITIFVVRKGRRWKQLSLVISSLGTLSFVFLLYRNTSIHFTNGYVHIFTVVGAFACLVCAAYTFAKLKGLNSKKLAIVSPDDHFSFWPLWGGLFLFACYAFYEFLCRVTFGINEPCDSCWALSLLPLMFTAWAWGFFNIRIEPKLRKKILMMIGVLVLLLAPLSVISYLPYRSFKQSYGMISSLLLILLWISVFAYILWHVGSSSKYYIFSNWKRAIATALGSLVILAAYFLNLGYNPFEIAPKSVSHVSSWRSVIVCGNDSLGNKKFGIVYPTDGETIVPCCIADSIIIGKDTTSNRIDSLLWKGEYPFVGGKVPIVSTFVQSPFKDSNFYHNNDKSLSWNSRKLQMKAYIPSAPTLKQYLHRILSNKLSAGGNIADSIDYYAAKLFSELRTANINFAVKGETYNLTALKSLNKLDSLQQIALFNEIATLKDSITYISSGLIKKRASVEVLEDKYLVDFHRELSRTFLLSLMKDRASQSDMPAMFTLANTYLLAFFTSVPAMNTNMNFIGTLDVKTRKNAGIEKIKYNISSDDILNKRLFAWYNIFNCLYLMDIGWNAKAYEERLNAFLNKMREYLIIQKETRSKLHSALSNVTNINNMFNESLKDSATLVEKVSNLLKARENIRKMGDSFESILSQYEGMELILNTYTIDESFNQLKDTVLHTLLPIMEKHKTGIYNNDLENICKGLILVATFRGNDVQKDMDSLSNYLSEKSNLVVRLNNINENLDSLIEQKKIFLEKLNEMIEMIEK